MDYTVDQKNLTFAEVFFNFWKEKCFAPDVKNVKRTHV